MRKLTVFALLLPLLAAALQPVTCAGWESSAADRMACCHRAHHEACTDQAAADGCCARQEEARHFASCPAGVVTVPAPVFGVVTAAFEGATLSLPTTAGFDARALGGPHERPNVSPPPLRI